MRDNICILDSRVFIIANNYAYTEFCEREIPS